MLAYSLRELARLEHLIKWINSLAIIASLLLSLLLGVAVKVIRKLVAVSTAWVSPIKFKVNMYSSASYSVSETSKRKTRTKWQLCSK
jgi:ABC-type sulfate transport system permease component